MTPEDKQTHVISSLKRTYVLMFTLVFAFTYFASSAVEDITNEKMVQEISQFVALEQIVNNQKSISATLKWNDLPGFGEPLIFVPQLLPAQLPPLETMAGLTSFLFRSFLPT